MHEEQITQVTKVLEEWNPLGDAANNVDGLDGYRYEAIDIISAIELLASQNKVKKAIEQVLTEAFNIELDQAELAEAAKRVEQLLGAD
jgi:hypothetical protein